MKKYRNPTLRKFKDCLIIDQNMNEFKYLKLKVPDDICTSNANTVYIWFKIPVLLEYQADLRVQQQICTIKYTYKGKKDCILDE